MRILITGITGLVGSHLADYALSLPEVQVTGFKRWRSPDQNIRHLAGKIELIEGDIEDPFSVAGAIEHTRPDRIFHLAAQSYPSESWAAPTTTIRANLMG